MASMNDIKRRKESVTSTGQITKAMKLVSTVRLQKAKKTAEDSKEYFVSMYETVTNLLGKLKNVNHPFVRGGDSEKKAVLVLSSNRGLAGGYNGNIIKEVLKNNFDKDNTLIFTIGQKGRDALVHSGYSIYKDYGEIGENPEYLNAKRVCDELILLYKNGKIGEIYIAYTLFKNTVVHIPTFQKLLPINSEDIQEEKSESDSNLSNSNKDEEKKDDNVLMTFEMDDSEALELLVPKYITSMIYGAMLQSVASENGARMQAMDSATSNAQEMIDKLTLLYNRARQGSITQELTEIIAGADAIG